MFLLKTFNFLKGYITVRAEGFFVERMINLCQVKNIRVWGLEFKYTGIIEFNVSPKDYEQIMEIAKITRSNIEIVRRDGALNLVKRYRYRKGFVLATLAVCGIIYFLNMRIWNIEVVGNTNVSLEEIYDELRFESFKVGVLKKEIDFNKIKSNIYQRRNDILWLGINIKGTRAIVEVVERANPQEDSMKDKFCDIVSNKDGIIESIYVKEGAAKVKKGDVVFKGDVLVSGVVTSDYAEDRYVSSNAEITIRTWYTGKTAIPYEKTILVKSGNRHNSYKLRVGNCVINLRNASTNFEKYDTINNVKKLNLFGKFELPVKLETVTYEEYISDEIKYSREQAEIIAKTNALKIAKQSIPKDSQIVNCEYNVFEDENEVIVRATVMCIESVGIKEEIQLNVM